uniref:Adenylate kinase n=1 Tax=Macrostomum lignano TaxID=282301 RepID=A0A1I8FJM4_9PLAT
MSDAKEYVSKKQIPQLFECLMTGLMYHRPSDHIAYLQQCLDKIKVQGVSGVRWDLFLEAKRAKTPLPPVTPPRSAKRSTSHMLVLGGPGSGKRVICRHLAQRYGFASLCVGDLVRNGIRDSRDASRQRWAVAAAAFERGDAVPEDLLLPALIDAVNQLVADGRCRGVFVEGYPRSPEQVDAIAEHIKQPDRALLLDFEEDLLQERLLRRYHRLGAIEDQPANIGRRIGHFRSAGLPACQIYDEARRLVVVPVDEDLDDASVFAEAARAMDAFYDPVDTSAGPRRRKGRRRGAPTRETTPKKESEAAAVSASAVTYIEGENVPEPVKRPGPAASAIVAGDGRPVRTGHGRSSHGCAEVGPIGATARASCTSTGLRGESRGQQTSALVPRARRQPVLALVPEHRPQKRPRRANCILLEGYPITQPAARPVQNRWPARPHRELLDCEETYMECAGCWAGPRARARDGWPGAKHCRRVKAVSVILRSHVPVVPDFDFAGKWQLSLRTMPARRGQRMPARMRMDEDTTAAETIQAAFDGFKTREEFCGCSAIRAAEWRGGGQLN